MKTLLTGTLLGLCALGTGTGIYLHQNQSDVNNQAVPKPQPRQNQKEEHTLRFTAVIVPTRVFHVYPRVGGILREMLVEEGDKVKMGQVLARLDPTEYALKYQKALAMVDRARAYLAEEEANIKKHAQAIKQADVEVKESAALLQLAEKKTSRLLALQHNGSIDDQLVTEAEVQAKAAEAHEQQCEAKLRMLELEPRKEALNVAKAELTAAEVERDFAKLCLDRTEIQSPANGTILAKEAEVNAIVGPGPGSKQALSVYRVGDLSQMDAVVDLPENSIGQVAIGQKCAVQVDSAPSLQYSGHVSRICPVISNQTHTLPVRIVLEGGNQPMPKPGSFAEIELTEKH
jgi:HlyD family secretion protein